jgi:vanillate O-demethylase ferredoxin subunit
VFALAEGDVVRISEPRNNFPLSFDRPDYLMVAAGIGITPIIGMALALKRRGARVRLIYAASASDELAFARELDEQFDGVWERAVSSAGTRMNVRSALASVLPDGEVYICGPTRLLEEARAEWQALGRRIESLRFETFASGGNFAARPFTVKLPHLGMQIEVRGTETIVEALRRANVDVLFDCLRGECGLCALPVLALEGEIDHRDVFLSAAEKKEGTRICACVSRIVGEAISLDNGFRAHHVMD